MSEQEKPESFEEQVAACPIHRWADIDGYLEQAQVPTDLHRPFHELVLARGEYPKDCSSEQGKEFARRAVDLTRYHEIQPMKAHALKMIFSQLIGQWLAEQPENN